MTKLPKGPLKIIAPIEANARANRQRQSTGSTKYKPVWNVYVLDADGTKFVAYLATTFRSSGLTPRHEPRGIKVAYPQANSAMRTALDAGLWFETRSEIILDFTVESLQETVDNG